MHTYRHILMANSFHDLTRHIPWVCHKPYQVAGGVPSLWSLWMPRNLSTCGWGEWFVFTSLKQKRSKRVSRRQNDHSVLGFFGVEISNSIFLGLGLREQLQEKEKRMLSLCDLVQISLETTPLMGERVWSAFLARCSVPQKKIHMANC